VLCKRWVCTVACHQIGNRLISKNRIGAADRGLYIFEWIPGKAEARLEVLCVGVIDRSDAVIHLNQRINFGYVIDETIEALSRRHQPVVTETKLEGEIGPELVVILDEDSESALRDRGGNIRHTLLWSQRNRECVSGTGEKRSHVRKGEGAGVLVGVVVIKAPHFTTEPEGMVTAQVAERVRHDVSSVRTTLREACRAAEIQTRSGNRDLRQSDWLVYAVHDAEVERIQLRIRREGD